MLGRGAPLIRSIEAVLLDEIKLQMSYAAVIGEENSFITKFKTDKIQELCAKREALYLQIALAKEKREALTIELAQGHPGHQLRTLLKSNAHRDDAIRLTRLADKLRILVQANHLRSREFSRLAHFALTLVNGSLSILWSATQSISRAYGRNRVIKETFAPKTRSQMTIEEA